MDELSEFPPTLGSNIVIVNNQSHDGRIHQYRCSTVLGLTSFDSRKTADEIMRTWGERRVARKLDPTKKRSVDRKR